MGSGPTQEVWGIVVSAMMFTTRKVRVDHKRLWSARRVVCHGVLRAKEKQEWKQTVSTETKGDSE
jgi:hypothetical protein